MTLELRRTESGSTESGGVELCVSVVNGPGGPGEPALGSGLGLIGLAERGQLLGGTLDHGPTESGFELRALIPFKPQGKQEFSGVVP